MSSLIDVQHTGIPEIRKRMKGVPLRIVKQVLRPSVRAAASPVTKEARKEIDRHSLIETGALRRSIGVKVKTYRNRAVWAGIGPRKGFNLMYRGKNRDPRKYAHLLEKGTKNQRRTPFMRPASDHTRSQQYSAFVSKARTHMNKLKI